MRFPFVDVGNLIGLEVKRNIVNMKRVRPN